MERDYDLFEIHPDGSLVWRYVVKGHDAAIAKLREFAEKTKNEVRVMHVLTHSIVAILNASYATVPTPRLPRTNIPEVPHLRGS